MRRRRRLPGRHDVSPDLVSQWFCFRFIMATMDGRGWCLICCCFFWSSTSSRDPVAHLTRFWFCPFRCHNVVNSYGVAVFTQICWESRGMTVIGFRCLTLPTCWTTSPKGAIPSTIVRVTTSLWRCSDRPWINSSVLTCLVYISILRKFLNGT